MLDYRTRYHYPWRWAVLGELAWRLEHLPLFHWSDEPEDNNRLGFRVCTRIRSWAYVQRKSCEHRGSPLLREQGQRVGKLSVMAPSDFSEQKPERSI